LLKQNEGVGKMSQEIILKIGDTIEYAQGLRALIEKIRIISTGKFVEEYAYSGDSNDVVLTLSVVRVLSISGSKINLYS